MLKCTSDDKGPRPRTVSIHLYLYSSNSDKLFSESIVSLSLLSIDDNRHCIPVVVANYDQPDLYVLFLSLSEKVYLFISIIDQYGQFAILLFG
jgi:hypothetical protein